MTVLPVFAFFDGGSIEAENAAFRVVADERSSFEGVECLS